MSYPTYLNKIRKFHQTNHRLPTYSEICNIMGFASRNAAYRLMHKLVDDGLVQKIGQRFSPTENFFTLPLLGSIKAGVPSLVEEEPAELVKLNDYLLGGASGETCLLRVSGDSMIEAGINPGDLAVIDTDRDPHNGNVVAAMVDGAWTLKTFRRMGNQVVLLPANKNYKPITATDELIIGGVMISLIRRYRH